MIAFKKGFKILMLLLLAASYSQVSGQIYVTLGVNQPASLVAAAGSNFLLCEGDSSNLGGVPAALNGTAPYAYQWTPATGLSSSTVANPMASPVLSTMYVLEVSDVNGCTALDTVSVTVDTCVGIDPNAGWNPLLALFPNPSQGSFTLSLEQANATEPVKIEIWNLAGQRIFEAQPEMQSGKFETRIDISAYGKGTYLITLSSTQGTVTRKMLVQ